MLLLSVLGSTKKEKEDNKESHGARENGDKRKPRSEKVDVIFLLKRSP